MTQQTRAKNRFAGGELSPSLYSREDIDAYDACIGDSLNVMASNKGELIARPGTIYSRKTQSGTKRTRLIPFRPTENESYLLEFSHYKLKIYDASGAEISSDVDVQFDTGNFGVGWSGDNERLFVRGLHPGVFPLQVGQAVTIDSDSAATNLQFDELTAPGVLAGSPVANVDGTTVWYIVDIRHWESPSNRQITDSITISSTPGGNPFAVTTALNAACTDVYMTALNTEWPSPYSEDELEEIQYCQSGDLAFFTHPSHQPMKLTRLASSDFTFHKHFLRHGPWRSEATYGEEWVGSNDYGYPGWPFPPGNTDSGTNRLNLYGSRVELRTTDGHEASRGPSSGIDIDPNIAVGRYMKLYAHDDNFDVGYAACEVYIDEYRSGVATPFLQGRVTKKAILFSDHDANGSKDSLFYGPYLEGGPNSVGSGGIYANKSALTKLGKLYEEPVGNVGGWPKSCTIWDGRLVYAGGGSSYTISFSSKFDFDDWSEDDWGRWPDGDSPHQFVPASGSWSRPTVNVDNGWTYTIQSDSVSEVQWVFGTPRGLVVATTNNVFLSDKIDSAEQYSGNNFELNMIVESGASDTRPIYLDDRLFYASLTGKRLLSIQYSVASDVYEPTIEALLAEHLLQDGIKEMIVMKEPIQTIWITTRTGGLLSYVILKEQKQAGLFKHKISCGEESALVVSPTTVVDSIAIIPSEDLGYERMWMVVAVADRDGGFYADLGRIIYMSRFYEDGMDLSLYNGLDCAIINPNRFVIDDIKRTSITQVRLKTQSAHGISGSDYFVPIGLSGTLSGLNGSRYQISSVPAVTEIIANISDVTRDNSTVYRAKVAKILKHWGTTANYDYDLSLGDASVFEGLFQLTHLTDYYTYVLESPPGTPVSHYWQFPNDNSGYNARIGFKPVTYVNLLPMQADNQMGSGHANYALMSKLSLRVNETVGVQMGRTSDEIYYVVPTAPNSLANTTRTNTGVFEAEVGTLEQDFDGAIYIEPDAGLPFRLLGVYYRMERSSR